jgi:hypothetical protein
VRQVSRLPLAYACPLLGWQARRRREAGGAGSVEDVAGELIGTDLEHGVGVEVHDE